ncbi:MAG: polysaccharide biosynthesis protein [Rhodospirillales bacterium]|jgi:FlaA1/EpsC-like NDP-sugar epimerase|nr:polysaccharide biosynthesis protein [Rhodospirillales bacterium]
MLARISARGMIAFAHDIVMAAVAFVLAIYLRLGDSTTFYSTDLFVSGTITLCVIAAFVFWFMGLYRGIWRYASLEDLWAIARASTLVVLFFLMAMFLWTRLDGLPRSLPFITWFVLMALLGGPRFLYRLYKDRRIDFKLGADGITRIPVLLVGSGDAAELFIRAVSRGRDAAYQAVGIVSERPDRVGRILHGIEVMGSTDQLAEVVKRLSASGHKPQRLVLTAENMDGTRVRRLLDDADKLGMTLARMPNLTDFKAGIEDKAEIRPIAVEDLLGRPQMPLDRDAMAGLVAGKRVLVTGAGGSIGSELVRQICGFGPAEIVLLDNSEYHLYQIDLEVSEGFPDQARSAVIADVRDARRLKHIFGEYRPELVFHAAALKHVPLVEANHFEGVMTNVIGTANVAQTCRSAGVSMMVLISSDKAVNPTNIMGATKRIAEQVCQAMDLERSEGDGTRFVTVRFGNVLGSTGSVVPLFQRQLAAGGPLSVTDPDMTRYFMTIREAVELVLEASAAGSARTDYAGRIFVLEMGEPVKILDLARQMIRLAGMRAGEDVAIEIVGLRPGEKLHEELFHGGEELVSTEYEGIMVGTPRSPDANEISRIINALTQACAEANETALIESIHALVPEYNREKKPGES